MSRITADQYAELLTKADKVEARGAVDNATRKGTYVSLRQGLVSRAYFVGIARDEANAFVIERVG